MADGGAGVGFGEHQEACGFSGMGGKRKAAGGCEAGMVGIGIGDDEGQCT